MWLDAFRMGDGPLACMSAGARGSAWVSHLSATGAASPACTQYKVKRWPASECSLQLAKNTVAMCSEEGSPCAVLPIIPLQSLCLARCAPSCQLWLQHCHHNRLWSFYAHFDNRSSAKFC